MSIKERVMLCRLIEKMEKQPEYSKRLKIENHSGFREKEKGEK